MPSDSVRNHNFRINIVMITFEQLKETIERKDALGRYL